MFSALYGIHFPFQVLFNMLSAICFTVDKSEILSSGVMG